MRGIQKPSRRIIILLSLATLFIAFLFYRRFWHKAPDSIPLVNVSYEAASNADEKFTINGIDENKNDVPDWKEMLLASTTSEESKDDAPKTLSDNVARTLFANVVYLTQNGQQNLSEGDQAALVGDMVDKLQNSFVYKVYTANDLRIDQSSSVASVRLYAITLASYQLNLILDMQKNVDLIQSDLGVLGEIYAKQANYVAAIKVPKELADTHLQIVNNFSRSAAAFEAFSKEKEDPILIPIAMRAYQDASTEQELLLKQEAQFFKDNGIIFSQTEVGNYWNAFGNQQ